MKFANTLTPLIYFEYKTRHMHHWYRNTQSLRSLPLEKSR